MYNMISLSLSGACQEDVAASTSVRHAGLSQARRLADNMINKAINQIWDGS